LKILLDQNVPAILRRFLIGHTTIASSEIGWTELANGVLLAAAERAGFDVLVTGDKNIPRQQNLSGRRIALVILGNQRWPVIKPDVEMIVARIGSVRAGEHVFIPVDRPALRRRPHPQKPAI
jgi:predicted nuclease of predicted toxin-antitoxin system